MVRKEKISVTLDPTIVGELSDRIGEEYDNRSEAVKDLLGIALSVDEERAAYEERIERLEQENERLQCRVEKVIAMNEEHGELVEYVSRETSLQIQREARQNARSGNVATGRSSDAGN